MNTISDFLVAGAVVAVATVLCMGLANLWVGGTSDRSQKLMRWRIIMQFGAIIVIMGVLWLRTRA